MLSPAPTYTNLYQFLNDHITPMHVTLEVESQLFPAVLAWAPAGETYQFMQDCKEDSGYSRNIIFPCPEAGFIFRKMAEWNENVSL